MISIDDSQRGCARKFRNTLVGSKTIPPNLSNVDMGGGGFGTEGSRAKLNAKSKIPSAQTDNPVPIPPVTTLAIPRTRMMIPKTTNARPAHIKFAGRLRSGSGSTTGGGGG